MNNTKSIIFIFSFLLLLAGCKTEQDINKPAELLTVEQAKMWYDAQYSNGYCSSNRMKVVGKDSTASKLELFLQWNNAELENDSLWSVVELPWKYLNGGIKIASGDCAKESKSILKVVFMKNLSTANVYGFKMAIIPDSDYKTSSSNFENSNSYLKRKSDFSGLVMYYSLNDQFVNGWKYENGTVVESLIQVDASKTSSKMPKNSKIAQMADIVAVTTCNLYSVQTVGYDDISYHQICSTEYYVMGGGTSTDSGGGTLGSYDYDANSATSGGGSFSSSDPPTPPPTIKPSENCDEVAAANGDSISKILKTNNSSAAYYKISDYIDQLIGYAYTSSVEWGMVINYAGGEFYALNNTEGNYVYSNQQSTEIGLEYLPNTYILCHTHPTGTISSPSPSDAGTLVLRYNKGTTNIFANVILAANGSQYVVYVNDRAAFNAFCGNDLNSRFYEKTSDNRFPTGTTWNNAYNTVYNNLQEQGYSDDDCNSYALSYVFGKYNTGLKISQRSDNNSAFKEQSTEKETSTVTSKNTTIYTPTKCN